MSTGSNLKRKAEFVSRIDTVNFKHYHLALVFFAIMWMISNLAAQKLVNVFGITLTGGLLFFPFVTALSSVILEAYGYKNARRAIWIGITVNVVFIAALYLTYLLPSSPYWKLNDQFKQILLPGAKITFASILSFSIADFLNSYLMAKIKILSNGNFLFARIFIACAISFFLDVSVFLVIVFHGILPNHVLIILVCLAYLKKIIFQIILYPPSYALINFLKRSEGIDIFDFKTNFSPFSMDSDYETPKLNPINHRNTGDLTKASNHAHI